MRLQLSKGANPGRPGHGRKVPGTPAAASRDSRQVHLVRLPASRKAGFFHGTKQAKGYSYYYYYIPPLI